MSTETQIHKHDRIRQAVKGFVDKCPKIYHKGKIILNPRKRFTLYCFYPPFYSDSSLSSFDEVAGWSGNITLITGTYQLSKELSFHTSFLVPENK